MKNHEINNGAHLGSNCAHSQNFTCNSDARTVIKLKAFRAPWTDGVSYLLLRHDVEVFMIH